jgi:hypothetical protein
MVVSVAEAPGGIISRDFAKDADAVVSLLASRPAAVVVNVGRVRDAVLRRLQAMGLIGSGPLDGTLDEILTRPASPAVASSQKERAASPARKPRRKGPR